MTFLVTLLFFIVWSTFVFLFANFTYRKNWSISTSPEFWLISFCVCFLPLLPLPALEQTISLPEVLQTNNVFTSVVQIVQTKVVQITNLELDVVEYCMIAGLALFSFKGLIQFGLGLLKTRQIILKSEQVELGDIFTEKQSSLLKKHKVKIKLTDDNISPFSFGFFNAYLILPRFILKLPKPQLKLLIDHELNHIERQDHRWLILVKLTAQLISFNPIFKRLERHYINAIELRCDKDVLSQVSDINLRKSYAEAMLKCLKHSVGVKEQPLAAHFSNPETGVSFYHTRLKAIMNHESKLANRKQLLLTAILMILTGVSMNVLSANYVEGFVNNIKSWQMPLKNINVTSPYGAINSFRNNVSHGGIDLKAAISTPVYAVRSGVVTVADSTSLHKNYGKVVVVKHADGYLSLYAHLKSFDVNKNEKISAGQVLGLTGNTGKTNGPHLHLEILKGEKRINPNQVLTF